MHLLIIYTMQVQVNCIIFIYILDYTNRFQCDECVRYGVREGLGGADTLHSVGEKVA